MRRRLDRVFLALGDDADEVADPDHGDEPGNIADRGLLDRDQAGADKRPGIDAGIGWSDHAAVQHAGHAHVVHIDQFAGRFRRKVDARHRLPDDRVGIDRFDLNAISQFEADRLSRDQFAVADAAVIPAAHEPIFDGEFCHGQLKPFRGARHQEMPGLCRGVAQGHGGDLNGFAGDGRALIGNARGIAEHDDDARKGYVEFLGDDLSERGTNAGSEIDMTVEGRDRTVDCYPDKGLEGALLAGDGRANDGQ